MRADFAKRWGTMPTPEQLTALINQAIDDELLYREARALALDFEDGSVRRRLVEKMRAVSDHPDRSQEELYREARALGLDDDVVIRRLLIAKMRLFLQQDQNETPLAEKDLQDYLDGHRERFMQPAEVTFSQVFLSTATHGDHPEKDAQAVLAKLDARPPSAEIVAELSDPFPLGLEFPAYSRSRIASRFGKGFAHQVFDCQNGTWSGPIASPYGLHLVFVHEKSPERHAAARGGPTANHSSRDGRTRGCAARARTGTAAQPSRDPRRRQGGSVRARQDLGSEAVIRKRLRTAVIGSSAPAGAVATVLSPLPLPNGSGCAGFGKKLRGSGLRL